MEAYLSLDIVSQLWLSNQELIFQSEIQNWQEYWASRWSELVKSDLLSACLLHLQACKKW